MGNRPTYESLEPRQTPAFSIGQRRRAQNEARWRTKSPVPPTMYDAPSLVSEAAVATIRKSFLTAKTSKDAWRSFKREGRLDPRQGMRADRGAQDIFKRKTGASTTHVRVAVLIDASGSMSGYGAVLPIPGQEDKHPLACTRKEAAGVFGATIAKALGTIPTVNLDVWQHSAGDWGGKSLTMKWRWTKGTPTRVFNEVATWSGPGGGNADGHALIALATRMQRTLKRGERGVIMVVSDGLPSVYAQGGLGNAGSALTDAVTACRKMGIDVLGVAIDGSDQSCYYGDGTVKFDGNWTALGKELARHIGKALASR